METNMIVVYCKSQKNIDFVDVFSSVPSKTLLNGLKVSLKGKLKTVYDAEAYLDQAIQNPWETYQTILSHIGSVKKVSVFNNLRISILLYPSGSMRLCASGKVPLDVIISTAKSFYVDFSADFASSKIACINAQATVHKPFNSLSSLENYISSKKKHFYKTVKPDFNFTRKRCGVYKLFVNHKLYFGITTHGVVQALGWNSFTDLNHFFNLIFN